MLQNSTDEEIDIAPHTSNASSHSEGDRESEASEQTACKEGTITDDHNLAYWTISRTHCQKVAKGVIIMLCVTTIYQTLNWHIHSFQMDLL